MKYKWAVQALSRTGNDQELAEFFLSPAFYPERVMHLLIDKERRKRARLSHHSKKSNLRRRNRLWLLATGLVTTAVITLVSCAVAAGPGLGGGGWDNIKSRFNIATSPYYKTWCSAQEQLRDFSVSGFIVMKSDGTLNPLVSGVDQKNYEQNLKRLQELPGENEFLRARLEELQGTVDSGKTYIEVDLARNLLMVKMGTQVLYSYPVTSGKGRTWLSGIRRYRNFRTPKGVFEVQKVDKNPVWYKPNWAWHERGEKPPQRIKMRDRAVRGILGRWKISLGDGYSIHGTRSGRIKPGRRSHGCIRMNARDLDKVQRMVELGTKVYIY